VETVPSPPDPKQTIAGTIVLPAARRAEVKKGDTMFLIARRSDGPGGLLAVQRLQAGDFPMPFTLSSRDAMVPGTPLDGTVSITVRVDKDGDPITRRKGDVFGQASGIKVGSQDVQVSLDTVQKEDVTLNGPVGGAPPAGHGMPPGHP
jgi:cytochrome c-type biogenesis protein CcmH